MKNIRNIALAGVLALAAGCQDRFIDLDPQDSITEAVYFTTPEHFEYASNQLHTNLVGWSAIKGAGLPNEYRTAFADWMDFGTDLTALAQDEGRGTLTVSNSDPYWKSHYYFLRDANMIIKKGEEYTGDQSEIAPYLATGYFFRAYHHYELLTRFGGVPLALQVYDLDDELLHTGVRNSRYEVVAQIVADLDAAIENLPFEAEISDGEKGKISKEGAKALKARLMLFEATWEKYVGTTTDGDGVTVGAGSAKPEGYPSIDEMLSTAIELATDVIDNGPYELWNHNDELNNMSNYYLFNIDGDGSNPAGLTKSSNREFIIQGIYDFDLRRSGGNISHVVQGRIAPSRKMLDMFLCRDGLPISQSSQFQGYNTVYDELQNRDFRMQSYFGNIPENGSPALNAQSGSNAGVGIQAQKHKAFDYPNYRAQGQESQNFPYMRLAELLLIYAEAKFERDGSLSDADLNYSINKTRERAGIAPLTNALVTANGLDMLEEIRRERTIELYAENSRYLDLKRWAIAEEVLSETIYGPVIEGTVYETDASLYSPDYYLFPAEEITVGDGSQLETVVLDHHSVRNFTRKNYLFSIPLEALQLTSELLQNPEW
ncbi:RagB/SusD family nutrient uptake outer membrane protein [Marinoscillum furvescens]|uniref:Putative outer membrane starch-binding protein n=1 Tax=Marinoscillum furvescens DSM 4134 TaxID=1122208 RepID=A0A3D9L833_MARFU|nr:RagB/SusD family nutrient uptake outer membrane protein [Marinoscillum furvescens]REE02000.1 putative outer membrane starch-binding protein [Marinoscillum furvescens DSM 4134]